MVTKRVTKKNKDTIIILSSDHVEEALKLYESGAVYVLLPHLVGGHYVSTIVKKHGFDQLKFQEHKAEQIKLLEKKFA